MKLKLLKYNTPFKKFFPSKTEKLERYLDASYFTNICVYSTRKKLKEQNDLFKEMLLSNYFKLDRYEQIINDSEINENLFFSPIN